jgi:hypothetical protein
MADHAVAWAAWILRGAYRGPTSQTAGRSAGSANRSPGASWCGSPLEAWTLHPPIIHATIDTPVRRSLGLGAQPIADDEPWRTSVRHNEINPLTGSGIAPSERNPDLADPWQSCPQTSTTDVNRGDRLPLPDAP